MSSLESWAYLSRVVEGPNRHIQSLLAAGRTADEIAEGVRTRATWIGGLLRDTENRHTWDRPAQDLETAAAAGFQLLTPESPGWPDEELRVFGFVTQDPKNDTASLDANTIAPHALWVQGNTDLTSLCSHSVGFVGTRRVSPYGTIATRNLVQGLAKYSYTVVSGGALGVDTVAHQAALDSQMHTIAVAACGPGEIYPRANKPLFEKIVANGGSVLTEYPPGVTPDRHRFLTRNRLVAALTQGTVVVEAPYRSGALNTLKWVLDLKRVSMAVPGPITEQGSLGTNLAIQGERAAMVLNADQIHEQLTAIGTVDTEEQLEIQYPPDPIQQLSRNELRVYDALPLAGNPGKRAEDVAADAGFTIGLTVHILMDLEKRGVVQREKRFWGRSMLT